MCILLMGNEFVKTNLGKITCGTIGLETVLQPRRGVVRFYI